MTKPTVQAAPTPEPIAGLRGLEHVGLTVPDMAQALDFFGSVLGAEVLYEIGPLQASDNWMAVHLGVPADTVIARLVMVRIANGPTLELFEYAHGERHPGDATHAGAAHLAFYVDDIDAAVDTLHAHGVIALGEVKRVIDGPNAGLAWVHFIAPWGQQLELVSYPTGVAAYADRDPAVWRPGQEDDPPGTKPDAPDAEADVTVEA